MTPGVNFRSWALLNRAILKVSQARFARAWYGARFADKDGRGWLRRVEVVSALTSHLQIGVRAAQKLLWDGSDLWWSDNEDVLLLSSQNELADHFDVELGYAVELPASTLGKLQVFKASLFSTFFAKAGENRGVIISLEKLEELFGVSRSTLKTWIRLANLDARPLFAFTKRVDENTPIFDRMGRGVFLRDIDGNGERELIWQIPNLYIAKSLSPQKKHQSFGGPIYDPKQHWAKPKRIFFEDDKELCRQLRGAEPGEISYLFVKQESRLGALYELINSK